MSLLLFLSAPAGSSSAEAFWSEAAHAVGRNETVSVYLFHEGASALKDPRLPALLQKGLRLFSCPRAAETYGAGSQIEATLGGPGLLAELIERSAAFRPFNVT